MPIVTPAARSGKGSSFSRVNSFKRDWGDDQAASDAIPWSSSPDVRKHDTTATTTATATETAASANAAVAETASQRRRRAILAALNADNTYAPSEISMGLSKAIASQPGHLAPPHSSANLDATSRALPGPFDGKAGADRFYQPKRPLPWEEESSSSKKAMTTITQPTLVSKVQPKLKGSSSMTIKQQVVLSDEQKKVLMLVKEGKNIFYTGSAGTGKSVLLREIITTLRSKYVRTPEAVAVTASTGIAACNIGGVTLHSFGGVGLATDPAEVLVRRLRKNPKATARWMKTKVLIVDEVSMVDGDMFDKFCKLGQLMRKNTKPWGGIQIIVTGDFFQLPPVTNGGQPKFAFEAEMWNETIPISVNLSQVFRQKDPRFVDMLNEMRFGRLTSASIDTFKSLARPVKYSDGIEPTSLFPRREEVERANLYRLNQLHTEGHTYISVDGGKLEGAQRDKLLSNFMAPKTIELKVDAQVMLIKNLDETLANGSMGRIIGFCYRPFFLEEAGRWAPDAEFRHMDESERKRAIALRDGSLEKYKASGSPPLPVVRFKVPGGGTRDVLIEHDVFKSDLPNGETQAQRTQLPIILSWAMSIHKSQGQTLDRVKVDLGKVFEKGQAYVALSRATSLEGLEVRGFSADKVMAHKKVAIWSSTLKDLNVL
ncbi:hypothetical protein L202_01327 [Cryptococcus amylolentus CBS 6039]|uniref:ATP-dependent DNA helicase PIF1 n=2 Tax=Cryptococcus amylolentus TaxID=104669 RepID=A0A1E3I3G1_9TREE|nr:hypothetical protein L202_01327 [Cryptococcus amylolentus CBS 6039]ODN83122.1 hypothetical protein L202_01327 [Cryptococcus amylolentus CBS 6039]ODO10717.1 hypothetical protein I350_01314 [Cryptococcus amylolentus CBS 6273]